MRVVERILRDLVERNKKRARLIERNRPTAVSPDRRAINIPRNRATDSLIDKPDCLESPQRARA